MVASRGRPARGRKDEVTFALSRPAQGFVIPSPRVAGADGATSVVEPVGFDAEPSATAGNASQFELRADSQRMMTSLSRLPSVADRF